MTIDDIPSDCELTGVKVDILSRTITLYGDRGEEMEVVEANSDDFTRMCNFINETLEDKQEMIEYVF